MATPDLRTCSPDEYAAAYRADWVTGSHVAARARGRRPLAREFAVASVVVQEDCHSVLDVGCGEGHLAGLLASQGLEVSLLDCVPEAVDTAKRRVSKVDPLGPAWCFTGLAEAELANIPTGHVDAVTCCEMVEHVQDPARLLREMARVARRLVVLTTPVDHDYDDPLHLHHWKTAPQLCDALSVASAFRGGVVLVEKVSSRWGDGGHCWLLMARHAGA